MNKFYDLVIMNRFGDETNTFVKDVDSGHTIYRSKDQSLIMFLVEAPHSKRYGYHEPRVYLDVNKETNFSTIVIKPKTDCKKHKN